MTGQSTDGPPAFVLGFDGVPWSLVERWAAAGELPGFAAAIADGAAGPLASTTPPTTPVAWPAIATGVGADRHGIYGFQKLDASHDHRMYTSRDRARPALWEMASPAVVGNVPMTYPAEPVDGAMVTGMMTPSTEEGFTHPPGLAAEIREHLPGYRVALDWTAFDGTTREFRAELDALVETRRRLMRRLLAREWRLAFFVYTAPDRLQHLVWDEAVLLEHYRTLDGILREAMAVAAERGATLYVVSDHGFGPVSRYVHVNRALEREGLLVRRETGGTRGALASLGVTKERVRSVLARLGVDDAAVLAYLPRSVARSVAAHVPGEHALFDVAFGETRAFLHGPGNLYVNDAGRFDDGPVAPADVPAVTGEVATVLRSVRDPETGERALRVHDGDDLFPADDRSPDLVVTGREGYEVEVSLADRVFAPTGRKAASHRPEGLFLATGPAVEAGATPSGATVLDVAPTVLHAMGEPVPKHADGRVLREIFAPGSAPERRAKSRRDYAGDRAAGTAGDGDGARPPRAGDGAFDDVAERLRGLGYLE